MEAPQRTSGRTERLDPEVLRLLEAMDEQALPGLETLPPVEARRAAAEGLEAAGGDPEPVARVEDLTIPGPQCQVPIRVYSPEGPGELPALVYFHGGGWVVCDVNTHDTVCRRIARRAGAVVVSVDYRLSPEHKFPAALEDCYTATLWVSANAGRLGVDARRVAVGGDSAGGNLAAVVSMRCRDENGPALALQVLVYPVTNMASFDTPSYREFAEGYNLTRAEMEYFRAHYLGQEEDSRHPHVSPLLAPDLHGLPRALVITAECDVLRDEGEAYASRLKQAGVPVTCTRYAGMIHPFFSMPGLLRQARDAIGEVAAAVRSAQPTRA
jgi:acetyl esterase